MEMKGVRFERRGAVGALWIDDGKVNTFHAGSIAEIGLALEEAEADPEIQAVALIGRPGYLSAGLDLKRLPGLDRGELRRVVLSYGRLMLRLFAYPKATIAVATGHALAGGCVMLSACDKRIGAGGPWKIGLNEVGIGLFLPTFVVGLARAVLHPAALTEALLRGRVFDPEGARAAGFLDEVVAPEEAPERGLAVAAEMAALPGMAYRMTKRNLKALALRRAEETLEPEIDEFLSSGLFG